MTSKAIRSSRTSAIVAAAVAGALVAASPASAATQRRHHAHSPQSVVAYSHHGRYAGYRALVSNGPGSSYGFHRLPPGYVVGAAIHRRRQQDAVHSAILDDAVDSANPYGFGFYGDSVYGYGNNANYGVFSGADAYGSPYFAGFYGPGDGPDLGPLGHAYAD